MLECHRIAHRYRGRDSPALDDVTLVLPPGVTGLLGANGAGKSTLLRVLATVVEPQAGHVVFRGTRLDSKVERQTYRRSLGYLPQHFEFDPSFSVNDVMRYIGWLKEVPGAQLDARVVEALAAVELTGSERKRVKHLSGGMRQRLGIAQAIVDSPSVIILDEPTVGLDPRQRHAFRSLLLRLAESACVLLSTHLTEDIAQVAGAVAVLDDGRVVFDDAVAVLAHRGGGTAGDVGAIDRGVLAVLGAHTPAVP